MALHTAATENTQTSTTPSTGMSRWQAIVVGIATIALFAFGVWMRLRDLGLPFDRDGYDEGVYWQTLRAMSAGHALYQQTFYSQPPFFLLSIFPFYTLFSQTIWAARFGVVIISLLGLVGAFLLGKALVGRVGALAALLLLVADPLYLIQSQNLQAEAPYVAFSLLAIGLAYLWWQRPDGLVGLCLAVLTAVTLSLGILCKLLPAALVPAGLLLLTQLYRISRQEPGTRWRSARSLVAAIVAFLITTALVTLPFVGPQFWQSMVTFHTNAFTVFKSQQVKNWPTILLLLQTSALSYSALYGTVVALIRRDWRVLPLLAWLLASIYLLWQQTPLFTHHFVVLTPPLIALTVMGIVPIRLRQKLTLNFAYVTTIIAIVGVLIVGAVNVQASRHALYLKRAQGASPVTAQDLLVARDVRNATQPGQLVITDAQFLVALADRSTPPSLVDTSQVRIATGYVTQQQLIQEASQPQVHAVLFYTKRLDSPLTAGFHAWVAQHFRLVHDYGHGRELWVKL